MKKNAFLVCRTMPARNATPRSTAASGLRGRLKPPRLRLQGTASVAGAGGGQGFQSPRGVSLIVQGTPMRTHTAEREGKGLADSVVQALRVLESQPPPATMAELARDNFAPSLSGGLRDTSLLFQGPLKKRLSYLLLFADVLTGSHLRSSLFRRPRLNLKWRRLKKPQPTSHASTRCVLRVSGMRLAALTALCCAHELHQTYRSK